jgi:broad specificity phosphatase PhoE
MRSRALFRLSLQLIVALSAVPLAAQEPTVVILVRHAEKAALPANDPPLSAEGEARARALAGELADAHVDAIVTTQLARTRLTAAPLAEALHLAATIVATDGTALAHARAVADTIRARYTGRTVLVVGHSNTIPKIITALGGPPLDDFCDNQYDGLYTVVIRSNGIVSLVRGHFGAGDGPAPAGCTATMPARS